MSISTTMFRRLRKAAVSPQVLSALPLPRAWRPPNPALRPAMIDYETHPYISPIFNEITQEEKDQGLEAVLPAILSDVESALGTDKAVPPRDQLDKQTRSVFDRLWQEGAVSLRIPSAQKKALVQALGPMIAATEEKLAANHEERMVHADIRTDCATAEQPEVMEVLNGILADSGVFQMAAVYCGKPITVQYLALILTQAADMESIFGTYYEDAWGTKPQEPLKAVYYHVDTMPGCPLKMMLYVSDVGLDNGPFQYVMGSSRAADPLDLLIRKRTDTLDLNHRQVMALPKELRRKSHFGFDLLDDTPETKAYLKHEKSFCSSEGDMVLFDSNGIHRGGVVKKEPRVALSLLLG